MGLVKASSKGDVVPILDAWIRGQKISKVYVDGGAQMCVMTERVMHRLKLEVNSPSQFRVALANNASIKCMGVIKNLRITVCDIEVEVDMYIIQSKGEGYPIILGRPWLIAMNADQKWGAGVLILKPEGDRGISSQRVTYDMRKGKELDIRYETTVDEETSTYSTTESEEVSSSDEESSSLDAMGATFRPEECSKDEFLSEKGDEEQESRLRRCLQMT